MFQNRRPARPDIKIKPRIKNLSVEVEVRLHFLAVRIQHKVLWPFFASFYCFLNWPFHSRILMHNKARCDVLRRWDIKPSSLVEGNKFFWETCRHNCLLSATSNHLPWICSQLVTAKYWYSSNKLQGAFLQKIAALRHENIKLRKKEHGRNKKNRISVKLFCVYRQNGWRNRLR